MTLNVTAIFIKSILLNNVWNCATVYNVRYYQGNMNRYARIYYAYTWLLFRCIYKGATNRKENRLYFGKFITKVLLSKTIDRW